MWLVYASASAFCFGLRGILYQWSSRKPVDRNLMLLGVFTFGAAVTLLVNVAEEQAWSWGALAGIMMGVFSFMSNMSMYRGFAVGKASLVAVFTALPAAVVSIGAYILWRETLNAWQLGALCIILLGIVVIRYSNDLSLSNLRGVQWAILAMFGFAITDLFSKQSQLWHAEVLPTLTTMFATGTLLFLIVWLREVGQAGGRSGARGMVGRGGKEHGRNEENGAGSVADGTAGAAGEIAAAAEEQAGAPGGAATAETTGVASDAAAPTTRWSGRRSFLWGMLVGSTNVSGMMLILPAFRLGAAGLVSAVIATSVLLILLFTRVYLKERFTQPQLLGIGLAIAGVLLLRLLE